MSSTHTYLNHTADIAFDVEADSIGELFAEAFKGWLESVVEIKNYESNGEVEIKLASDSLEQLLVDFLNEVNYLLTVKKILCVEIIRLEINKEEYVLNVVLKKYDLNNTSLLKEEIKSVTYHQMNIKKVESKYYVRVVFDI